MTLVKHKPSSKPPKPHKPAEVQYIKIYPCGCKAGPGPENLPDYCPEHGHAPGTEPPPEKGPDVAPPAPTSFLAPDIEVVAAKLHAAWMSEKTAAGITSRLTADGIEQMVPYDQLPENIKDLDRVSVRAVYAAIADAQKA